MLGFGIFGYFLKMYGFQLGPVVLGIILGPLMENYYRRFMMDVHHSIPGFFWEMIRHPLSLTLLLANIFSVVTQTKTWTRIIGKVKKLW